MQKQREVKIDEILLTNDTG